VVYKNNRRCGRLAYYRQIALQTNNKTKKMNIKLKTRLIVATIALTGWCMEIAWCGHALAQVPYQIAANKNGSMKLSGTSTFHNWNMNAQTFAGDAQFNFAPGAAGKLSSIRSLSFSLPVLNLKSKDKGLDKNAYKALKSEEFKSILYTLSSSTVTAGKAANQYLVKTTGNLSIAGVTHTVSMNVDCVVNTDTTITCTGSNDLKMSDYGIKPPTFMLGAMKTGDAITLNYTLVYTK
jgi:polyisoprenoid-binding protein YceI